jgi:uncharacterized protein
MITYHDVSPAHFAALASGLGGPAAVGQLASVQHSKHLLLLRFLADAYSGDAACGAAVDVLVRADQRDPQSVTELITDPMVGAWAAETSRRLTDGARESTGSAAADLAQLGALAAAAALRTGMDANVSTQALSGTVTLPTLGTAVLGSDCPATVTISGGRTTVAGGSVQVTVSADDPRWRELRQMAAREGNLSASMAIEDSNPYRDCYHVPAADRLLADEVRQWQDQFTEAWQLLARFAPERAAELATGLRSVVPLVTEDGVARSGTARDAFGTLGLSRPQSAGELAVTLVHEFQHSKLGVLLDVVPLYTSGGAERYFAPWRTDPRPIGGLIQGVYAFLAVADTWRALRSASGLEESATSEFAFVREQVAVGLAALEGSAELTLKGREFTAGLRKAMDRLNAEQVPASAMAAAVVRLNRRRRAWLGDSTDMSSAGTVTR